MYLSLNVVLSNLGSSVRFLVAAVLIASPNLILKKSIPGVAGWILFVATVLTVSGQERNTDHGAKLGNAYSIGPFDTVNTTNGNLMFSFPLGSLPAGRGQASAGIGLFYNSKLYKTRTTKIRDERYPCDWVEEGPENCAYYYKTTLEQNPTGGWTYGWRYSLESENRLNSYDLNNMPECRTYGSPNTMWEEMSYIHKLRIVLPDGTRHEMLPQAYSDSSYLQDNFYRVRFDGLIENCGGAQTRTGAAMSYYSDDGSYLRLAFSYDNDTNADNNTWTLYFPDGSKVTSGGYFSGASQKVYDRNGNYVDELTDQFNRSVTSSAGGGGEQFTVKGVNGQNITWTVTWKDIYVKKTYHSCEDTCPDYEWRSDLDIWFSVIDTITEPSQMGGRTYVFSYNAHPYPNPPSGQSNGWGEVSKVLLPTRNSSTEDAKITYAYDMDGEDGPNDFGVSYDLDKILNNFPISKTVTHDGESDVWNYSTSTAGGSTTEPDGGTTVNHFYNTHPTYPSWKDGLTFKTEYPNGSKVEKVWAENKPQSNCNTCNPYVKAEYTSIKSGGSYTLTSAKHYTLDKNGNATQVAEYDWMPYSAVARTYDFPNATQTGISSYLKRKTVSTYYNDTPEASTSTYSDYDIYSSGLSKRLLRLTKSVEVQDSSSTPKSRSELTYDYTNYDSSNTKGGNVTQTKSWDSFKGGSSQAYSNPLTTGNSITASATYNSYGMPTQTTDANGVQTSITYGGILGPSGYVYDLYPTQTVVASNYSSVDRTSSATYDFYTGVVKTATDNDNSVTTATDYDDLGRPTKVQSADGTALESWTQYTYNETSRYVIVKSDIVSVGDAKNVATTFFDQLGRPRLSKTLENAATQSATNETDGIKVETKYKISSGYTYQLTSNPYRTTSDATMGWTRSKTGTTGLHSEVETFSGSSLPAPWGSNTTSTGMVQTDIDANATTVTDQASKVRRSITDGLGQLSRVDEPTTSGLGTVASPNQATSYTYDVLNNLLTVSQGSQTRTFTYSSMSRLRTAANPESGTVTYSYDGNGNLTSRTDARSTPITTSYTYDALNRITQRSYNDSSPQTPTVTYTYDNKTNAVGRLTKVSSSVSTTEYTSFDLLGRVTGHKQTTGSDYTTSYTYNLAGQLLTETYPSGRMVQNTFATNGDLSQVQTKPSGGSYTNRASSFVYNPAGAVQSLQLGNSKYETTSFNARLQPTQIGLGTSTTDTSLLKLEYGYGTTANNGNVQSQTITVPGLTYTLNQTYTYDELSRIAAATETYNGSQTWKQEFSYDRYGNRNFVTGSGHTTTLGSCTTLCNPTFSSTTNRITSSGYTYDNAGNITADPSGKTFAYDAENKQTSVSNGSIGTYSY